MKSNKSDHSDLPESQSALIEKAGEILAAGGLSAEALSILIVGFHRKLREELHPAESHPETEAGLEEEDSPTDVPRLAHLTLDQSDKFHDALCHLEIIHEILMGHRNFSARSSLLLYPKEVFEQLEREFDAADQVIQA